MKMLIVTELGCAYRMYRGALEYAPLHQNMLLDTSEFGEVEPNLVGEERVTFRGVDTDLYGVFATVTRELMGES